MFKMDEYKIEKVEDLVGHIIGKNKKIMDTKISRLTAPGENNLSLVLSVDYTLKNEENGTQEQLHTVAKVMPKDSFLNNFYGQNYRNEVAFYKIVVPTLMEFQRQQGDEETIDIFVKLLTCRPNLHGKSEEVDENSVILMENLVALGYKNVDRLIGFDLETAKLILKDLALFHAVPFALKHLNPGVYARNIVPHFGEFQPPPPPKDGEEEDFPRPDGIASELIEETEELSEHLEKIKSYIKFQFPTNQPDGFYSAISHGDMWVNNIMTKFEGGKPIKNKFVDFQMPMENSIAADVLFFLFTSVQIPVLEESLDDLLRLYYDHFIADLDKLKYDTSSFTFENFLEEIRRVIKLAIGQIVGMSYFVVFGKKGGQPQNNEDSKLPPFLSKNNVTPEGREKVVFTLKEAIRRGWLD